MVFSDWEVLESHAPLLRAESRDNAYNLVASPS